MLRFLGVAKSYPAGRGRALTAVFHDITLEIAEGEFWCILGPSGCGKSTLLTLIAGFEHPTAGRIFLKDREVTQPGKDRAIIFQDFNAALLPWLTARENVEFGLRVQGVPRATRAERALRYLDLVGLGAHCDKFPSELSGGMKQRIQIARALVTEPELLLMDEPFGSLDAYTRLRMQRELLGIWEGSRRTVVFVTHDIGESIMLADRIAVMTPGPAARIKTVVTNSLPRPRDPSAPGFGQMFAQANSLLEWGMEGART